MASLLANLVRSCNKFLILRTVANSPLPNGNVQTLPAWVLSQSVSRRHFNVTPLRNQEDEEEEVEDAEEETSVTAVKGLRPMHDVETSKRYMKSKAYEITYRGAKVWEPYRRNHKGRLPPKKTRKTCIRGGIIATGNPCPICRDEYLVIDPSNVDLLKQFISPHTGQLISYEKTGVCQKQHKELLVALMKAWDLGYIEKPLPHRYYHPEEYYSHKKLEK